MIYNPNSSYYSIALIANARIKRMLMRSEFLKICTPAEREKYEERWSREDSAEKIADAINNLAMAERSRSIGFLGLF